MQVHQESSSPVIPSRSLNLSKALVFPSTQNKSAQVPCFPHWQFMQQYVAKLVAGWESFLRCIRKKQQGEEWELCHEWCSSHNSRECFGLCSELPAAATICLCAYQVASATMKPSLMVVIFGRHNWLGHIIFFRVGLLFYCCTCSTGNSSTEDAFLHHCIFTLGQLHQLMFQMSWAAIKGTKVLTEGEKPQPSPLSSL